MILAKIHPVTICAKLLSISEDKFVFANFVEGHPGVFCEA